MTPSKSLPNGSACVFLPLSLAGPSVAALRAGRRAEQHRSRCFFGSFPNGTSRSMPNVPCSAFRASRHQARVALAPTARSRRPAATASRRGRSRAGRSPRSAPRPWQAGQAPCGELNENARGDISGTLMPQYDARQPPREQPVAAVERVDHDDVVGQLQRDLDRLGQPPLDAARGRSAGRRRRRWCGCVRRSSCDVVLERLELAVDARLA